MNSRRYRKYRKENKLSWRERSDQKTMDLVSQGIHGNIPHSSGISEAKNQKGQTMLKTKNDSVFGEITYKHSWFKEDEVIFFGKLQKVKIKIKAFKDEEILQSQRDNYKNLKQLKLLIIS
ncbi:MAG: HNH endonuclease [Campylobacter sp.]